MNILMGIASKVRNTVELSGGGEDSSITTTHVAILYLDGKLIKIKSGEIIFIDNDDHITVVGRSRNGIFNACAYRNDTMGITGDIGSTALFVFGGVFSTAGLVIMNLFSDLVPIFLGLCFFIVGGAIIYEAIQRSDAAKLLKSHSPYL